MQVGESSRQGGSRHFYGCSGARDYGFYEYCTAQHVSGKSKRKKNVITKGAHSGMCDVGSRDLAECE